MTILQAVMQKFTRKQSPEPEVTEAAPRLADMVERYSALMELQAKRQLIEVVPSLQATDNELSCQSMILEINFSGGYLILDELFPRLDNLQLGDELTIKHHSHGELLTFTSRLLHIINDAGSLCYALALPEQVGYRQRRLYPRINLSQQQPLNVRLQSPWRTPWYAIAQNISAGGMRLTVGGNVLQQLNRGCILPTVEFKFNNEFQIRCQARVRAFRFCRRPYRQTQISIEFMDMGPQQRLQLQQFVNTLNNAQALAA